MATQTKIQLSAIIIWGAIFCLFAYLNGQSGAQTLPLPAKITAFSVEKEQEKWRFWQENGAWQLSFNGQNRAVSPERVATVLSKLRACHDPYPRAQVNLPEKTHRPIAIVIDERRYIIKDYNRLRRENYLEVDDSIWLCDEGIKAILAQPAKSWTQQN